jgi:hypothetical protein
MPEASCIVGRLVDTAAHETEVDRELRRTTCVGHALDRGEFAERELIRN